MLGVLIVSWVLIPTAWMVRRHRTQEEANRARREATDGWRSTLDAYNWLPGPGHSLADYDFDLTVEGTETRFNMLMWAAGQGDASLAQHLLDQGMDVNRRTTYGTTALIAAAIQPSPILSRMLIAHGAEVDVVHRQGNTALGMAIFYGYPDVVRELLEGGADPNLALDHGECYLHAVAKSDNCWYSPNAGERIADLLIVHGADVDAVKDEGVTPLMASAWNGRKLMVASLLLNGADATAANAHGQTALDIARRRGHVDLIPVLER